MTDRNEESKLSKAMARLNRALADLNDTMRAVAEAAAEARHAMVELRAEYRKKR